MSDLGELFEVVMAEAEAEGGDDTEDQVDNLETEPADENEDQVEEVETIGDEDESEDEIEVDESDEEATWDWTEYQDQMVPMLVDGEEQLVTLKELREAGMRQADYTRGKQRIAEIEKDAQWAQDFFVALANDPEGTIADVAAAYGLTVPGRQQETTKQAPEWNLDDLDEDVRPFAQAALQANQQLAEMRAMFEAQQSQAQQAQLVSEIRAELQTLKGQYGDDLDEREALQLAARGNLTLTEAAELVVNKTIASRTKLQGDVAKTAATEAVNKAEKKRQQSKKVASQKTPAFRATDIPVDDFSDIGELMAQIMEAEGSN